VLRARPRGEPRLVSKKKTVCNRMGVTRRGTCGRRGSCGQLQGLLKMGTKTARVRATRKGFLKEDHWMTRGGDQWAFPSAQLSRDLPWEGSLQPNSP
jgi:hypothetical protein